MSLTFKEFQETNERRCEAAFFPLHHWTAPEWACAIAGEVGEMCNLIKKQNRGDAIDLADIGREMADALDYIALLASYYGLDLEDITRAKFNEVSDRRNCSIKL
jgi:NTP pyrophosphatase (non-canonical NTP hydrolase)